MADAKLVFQLPQGADNPFVPKPGDFVAVCVHEPRPLWRRELLDTVAVGGVACAWFNLCRACQAGSPDVYGLRRLRWQLHRVNGVGALELEP